MSKRFITYEEAVALLPDTEMVHTFINASFGLMGADWSREEILEKLKKSDIIEMTGKMARKSGHGICAYNKDIKYQNEILFIETDMDKLERFDPRNGENDEQ